MLGYARGCPERVGGAGAAGWHAVLSQESLVASATVQVGAHGRAVAGRGTRYRADLCFPARVQRPQAGYVDRLAPRAAVLAEHEPPEVLVPPAGGAVARRGT